MRREHGDLLYGKYGFYDLFNPASAGPTSGSPTAASTPAKGWYDYNRHRPGLDPAPGSELPERFRLQAHGLCADPEGLKLAGSLGLLASPRNHKEGLASARPLLSSTGLVVGKFDRRPADIGRQIAPAAWREEDPLLLPPHGETPCRFRTLPSRRPGW